MSRARTARAALALLLLWLACASPAPAAQDFAGELLALINAYRCEHGQATLKADPALASLAAEHNAAMQQSGTPSHRGFDDRFERSGHRLCVENVGWNYPFAQGQFEGWKRSPSHDANLLAPEIRAAGIAKNGPYVTFFACE